MAHGSPSRRKSNADGLITALFDFVSGAYGVLLLWASDRIAFQAMLPCIGARESLKARFSATIAFGG